MLISLFFLTLTITYSANAESSSFQVNIRDDIKISENVEIFKITKTVIDENNIQSQNNSPTYEKSELDKLFEIMSEREKKTWRDGDVIIASATILAFFGFASFLTVQFRGKNRDRVYFLKYVDTVLISIFAIQFLQLITISFIATGIFDGLTYIILIILTIFALLIILITSRKIIHLQNVGDVKIEQGNEMVREVKQRYTYRMLEKARQANLELEKLQKLKEAEKKSK